MAGQRLEEDDSDGIDIALNGGPAPGQPFRRQVRGRTDDEPFLREVRAVGISLRGHRQFLRDTEVGELP